MLGNLTRMSPAVEELTIITSNDTNATNNDYDYDYDINDSYSHFDWEELAPVLIVYSLTFILGLAGKLRRTCVRQMSSRVLEQRDVTLVSALNR